MSGTSDMPDDSTTVVPPPCLPEHDPAGGICRSMRDNRLRRDVFPRVGADN